MTNDKNRSMSNVTSMDVWTESVRQAAADKRGVLIAKLSVLEERIAEIDTMIDGIEAVTTATKEVPVVRSKPHREAVEAKDKEAAPKERQVPRPTREQREVRQARPYTHVRQAVIDAVKSGLTTSHEITNAVVKATNIERHSAQMSLYNASKKGIVKRTGVQGAYYYTLADSTAA